jgi:hypothetical protein
LNALGIVAKDQQLSDSCLLGGKPDFLCAYGYVYLLLIFGCEPLGMSLCRLRGRLFTQRVNLKKRLNPSNIHSAIFNIQFPICAIPEKRPTRRKRRMPPLSLRPADRPASRMVSAQIPAYPRHPPGHGRTCRSWHSTEGRHSSSGTFSWYDHLPIGSDASSLWDCPWGPPEQALLILGFTKKLIHRFRRCGALAARRENAGISGYSELSQRSRKRCIGG